LKFNIYLSKLWGSLQWWGPVSSPSGRAAGSARSQVALWCRSQQNRVCRGGVSNRTQGASSSPVGARETRQCRGQDQKRVLPAPVGAVGGFGESRRFFRIERGTPSGLAPANRGKIAAHTGGKAASLIRGISKGGSPLGSLLHPFLERKGCARPGMRGCYWASGESPLPSRATYRWRKSRCGTMGNLVACAAAMSQIKFSARLADRRSASSRPGRGPATGGGSRAGGQCPLPDRAVAQWVT
jgi:hypothetical protein